MSCLPDLRRDPVSPIAKFCEQVQKRLVQFIAPAAAPPMNDLLPDGLEFQHQSIAQMDIQILKRYAVDEVGLQVGKGLEIRLQRTGIIDTP